MSIYEATANELTWFKSSYSDGEGGQCLEVAVQWRKSSFSGPEGGDCVEVGTAWRKSSHSDGEGGDCVEVADSPGIVHVRDSKDTDGPVLCFSADTWAAFVKSAV